MTGATPVRDATASNWPLLTGIVTVGLGHLAGWGLAATWLLGAWDIRILGEPDTSLVHIVGPAVLLVAFLMASGWFAARTMGRSHPLLLAGAAVVAFGVGLGVVGAGWVPFWRPPAAGLGLGLQLAILLPGWRATRTAARVAVPVAVDLLSTMVAEPTGFSGSWVVVVAVAWLFAALAGVVAVELRGR